MNGAEVPAGDSRLWGEIGGMKSIGKIRFHLLHLRKILCVTEGQGVQRYDRWTNGHSNRS